MLVKEGKGVMFEDVFKDEAEYLSVRSVGW